MGEVEAERLRRAFERLTSKVEFVPGDIVQWKRGLKNKKNPPEDGFAIVVQVIPRDEAGYSEDENSGSTYYREVLDLRLGVIDLDGDFVTYWFDSERFEKFE